jgi:NAD(P)-dependent dehydrogenase (short-subunit alcohol dehydrogenase family)
MLAERDRVLLVQADLTREDQVTSFLSHVSGVFGSVHYLAHTAGGYRGGSAVADVPTDEWEAMINVNLRTAFLVCRGVLDMMRRQNFGRIVNVAAMSALAPGAKKAAYAVSKRGVVTLTETIAEEVKGTGITANAIAPSIILTEENRQSMPNADFTKWVTPEEIAQLILYLCSDRSRSINGNVIKIYGGM